MGFFFFFFPFGMPSTHASSFGLQQNYKSETNVSIPLFKVSLRFTPERMFVSRRGGETKRYSTLQNEDRKKGKKWEKGKRKGQKEKKTKAEKQK